jgi:hydroxymethylpyrimidine/phosphomethylpyrimidine kinase
MMIDTSKRQNDRHPLILTIGGHDPSAAGIQADIESCAALGCMAISIVTALTIQNTAVVRRVIPSQPEDVRDQIRTVLEEFEPDGCKIGLVPNSAIAEIIAGILKIELNGCPKVVDPVIRAGSGGALAMDDMASTLVRDLVPLADVITPNADEVRALTGCDDLSQGVLQLQHTGCQSILVTDTVPDQELIINEFYIRDAAPERFELKRFPGSYHGTGCTLATAIACHRAIGRSIRDAVAEAQHFVHSAVREAHRFGGSQAIPNRFGRLTS